MSPLFLFLIVHTFYLQSPWLFLQTIWRQYQQRPAQPCAPTCSEKCWVRDFSPFTTGLQFIWRMPNSVGKEFAHSIKTVSLRPFQHYPTYNLEYWNCLDCKNKTFADEFNIVVSYARIILWTFFCRPIQVELEIFYEFSKNWRFGMFFFAEK